MFQAIVERAGELWLMHADESPLVGEHTEAVCVFDVLSIESSEFENQSRRVRVKMRPHGSHAVVRHFVGGGILEISSERQGTFLRFYSF